MGAQIGLLYEPMYFVLNRFIVYPKRCFVDSLGLSTLPYIRVSGLMFLKPTHQARDVKD